MPAEAIGCARPTGSVVGQTPADQGSGPNGKESISKEIMMTAKVGSKAPDFQAPAYHHGKFTTVQLSDYLGKWLLLCFYPGDFTFV